MSRSIMNLPNREEMKDAMGKLATTLSGEDYDSMSESEKKKWIAKAEKSKAEGIKEFGIGGHCFDDEEEIVSTDEQKADEGEQSSNGKKMPVVRIEEVNGLRVRAMKAGIDTKAFVEASMGKTEKDFPSIKDYEYEFITTYRTFEEKAEFFDEASSKMVEITKPGSYTGD